MTLPAHLFPFQVDAATQLMEDKPRVLGIPAGGGKSVIAIASWEEMNAMRILVVCPAIVRADWKAKVLKFGQEGYTIGADPGIGRTVAIRSFESLNSPSRRRYLLDKCSSFDLIVIDECQRLRNIASAITVSMYGQQASGRGLVVRSERVWPMSGTLAVNHIGDIYVHLHALAPELLPQRSGRPMTQAAFMDHFALTVRGRWGVRVKGLKNVEELRAIVRKFVIRCERSVIDAQLPQLMQDIKLLPASELDAKKFDELMGTPEGQALRVAVEMGDIWARTDSLAKARRILGELKVATVATYVRELLEEDEDAAVLVFGWHQQVLKGIADELIDIDPHRGLITGATSEATREACIASLQAGRSRVLVAGIGTMREGVTLTRANRVVFAEASWVPAENQQAIARAHRIGQGRNVIAEFIAIEGTLDEPLMHLCSAKSRLIESVFNQEQP